MSTGKILLARPNSFIVKHMKRLMEDSGNIPLPLKNIKELKSISNVDLKAIVISTSVSSVVAESYFDVLELVKDHYGDKPIFLATLTEVESVRRAFNQRAETSNIKLQSIEEACEEIDPHAIIVIKKSDLTDESLYQKTLTVMKKRLA